MSNHNDEQVIPSAVNPRQIPAQLPRQLLLKRRGLPHQATALHHHRYQRTAPCARFEIRGVQSSRGWMRGGKLQGQRP